MGLFEYLRHPKAKYNLDIVSRKHREQTEKMIVGIENILLEEKLYVVLVQEHKHSPCRYLETSNLQIKVRRFEAGLRSFDRTTS